MNDIITLKKELDEKIHNLFKNNKAYLDYILQTKSNFLYRYLETSTDKNIPIDFINSNTFIGKSYESNMGHAFKTQDDMIKEGVKNLAKSTPKEKAPRVQYSLKTVVENVQGDQGNIIIEAQVNWDFPDFSEETKNKKIKKVAFSYNDPNIFRKELALKYEEACELFS